MGKDCCHTFTLGNSSGYLDRDRITNEKNRSHGEHL